MKTIKLMQMTLVAAMAVGTTLVLADENDKNLVYFGGGAAQTGNSLKSNAAPYSIGYLRISGEGGGVIGLDYAGEGTLLDSTWGQNKAVKQSSSLNFLFGKNLAKTDSSRFDAGFLLGMRKSTTSCPSSYLGYQCYANTEPDNKYEVNYGAVVTWTYKSVMLGLRATGESTQALIGLKF